MSDPVTIGSLTVQALAWIGTEIAKTTVGEATKGAIKILRDIVTSKAGAELNALTTEPASEDKQLALAKTIDAQPQDEREKLHAALQTVLDCMKAEAPTIGVDLGPLRNVEAELGKITVTSGVGLHVASAEGGKLKIGDISVGAPLGK